MNDALREAVITEAKSWIRTPWHHEARVKGVGVDCVMLLCEVYERVGVLPHVTPEHYTEDVMLHRGKEIVLPYLDRYGRQIDFPEKGDVIVYHFGRAFSHAGICTGTGTLIHAYRPYGVVAETGPDEGFLQGRLRRYYTMRSE